MKNSKSPRLVREKGSFISHVATLVTGTALSQGINVVTLLLLTRLFAPEAFGLLALFMTIVSLLSVLGGARYELAVMLPESDQEAVNVFYLAVIVLGLICLACLAIIIPGHHLLASVLGEPEVDPWLWSVPAVLFVNGFNQVLGYWCGRMKRFRQVAVSRVAQAIGAVLAQVLLYALHMSGGVALIGGWIIGQTLGTAVLFAQVVRQDGHFLHEHHNWRVIKSSLWAYRQFPLYKAPYSFISNTSTQLVVLIIRFFSSLNTLGLFSMANRAIYLPTSLITSSMNQVFYQKAATENNVERLEEFVTRVLRIQVLLTTPLLVFAIFESKLIFSIVFGSRWTGSGEFAALLASAGYMYFLISWLDRLFDVNRRQRLSLILEIGGNLGSLAALACVLFLTKSAYWGVAAFTVAEVIYGIIWIICAYHVARFRVKRLRTVAWTALATGIPPLAVMGIVHSFIPAFWALILSTILILTLEVALYFRFVHRRHGLSSMPERFQEPRQDKTSPLPHGDTREEGALRRDESLSHNFVPLQDR